MCGIYVSIRDKRIDRSEEENDIDRELHAACALRGPDAKDSVTVILGNLELMMCASELRLRGNVPVVQPHRDVDGNVLCWNGEVFNGFPVDEDENDGIKLFSALCHTTTSEDVLDLMASIEGPYAMVYYQSHSRRLYITRDCLGRRSLLVHRPSDTNRVLFFASTLGRAMSDAQVEEFQTDSVMCIDLGVWADQTGDINLFRHYSSHMKRVKDIGPCDYVRPSVVNVDIPPDGLPIISTLSEIPSYLIDIVQIFDQQLDKRLADMIRNIPPVNQARLAILFSGGIDSVALAYYAHRHIAAQEPSDLLNVAFENPRKVRTKVASSTKGDVSIDAYSVPDRLSGLTEVKELCRVCPGRTWNFVHIDVPFEECQSHQSQVKTIMFPRNTVMDLSLANPLFFGARGRGYVLEAGEKVPYATNAKVLLSGLGADELLGGYGRHRTTFKFKSWQGLIEELQMELDRIPLRNLGRDDRIISSHGKECRHPFLSLDFVNYLASLPVHYKLDPRAEQGLGDKMLLRLLMHKVGLVEASTRHKKAMQFGSHSARMLGGASDNKGHLILLE